MAADRSIPRTGPGHIRHGLVALLVLCVGAAPSVADAQVPDPGAVTTGETSEEAVASATDDRLDRPVLTNAPEISSQARKWYRALNVNGSLGEGSVLLRLRVEPDGSVSDARVVRPGPHHPTLNALARRVAHRMVFSPVARGERGDETPAGGQPRWIEQRISFVR